GSRYRRGRGMNTTDIRIRLLGPFEVVVNGTPVRLPGERVRLALAALALSPGRTVMIDTLATQIWGDKLPERVNSSAQTLAHRIRTTLGRDVIGTADSGYVLRLDPDRVDVWRFRSLVARAGRLADDDHGAAREALTEALALWQGEPFAGLRADTSLR